MRDELRPIWRWLVFAACGNVALLGFNLWKGLWWLGVVNFTAAMVAIGVLVWSWRHSRPNRGPVD